MKIVFFGTGFFAECVLRRLLSLNISPALCVTQPDSRKGRGLTLMPSLVGRLAETEKLQVYKPAKLDGAACDVLRGIAPDIIVLADYGKILSADVIGIAGKFTLGVHPSKLPLYRGAAPVQRAIFDGCRETGVAVFKIVQAVDAGDIAVTRDVVIEKEDDARTLMEKLAVIGGELVNSVVTAIAEDKVQFIAQNNDVATYANKFTKKDAVIDWSSSAEDIVNSVRALVMWPVAETLYKGKRVQVIRGMVAGDKNEAVPGTVVKIDKSGISLSTGGGLLKITRVKPVGKNEIDAWSFVSGYRVKIGDMFGE